MWWSHSKQMTTIHYKFQHPLKTCGAPQNYKSKATNNHHNWILKPNVPLSFETNDHNTLPNKNIDRKWTPPLNKHWSHPKKQEPTNFQLVITSRVPFIEQWCRQIKPFYETKGRFSSVFPIFLKSLPLMQLKNRSWDGGIESLYLRQSIS